MFQHDDFLITHKNCLDGAACALIFLIFGGNEQNILFSSPSHTDVDALADEVLCSKKKDAVLYLADISVSQTFADRLGKRKDIILFDHHKSAIPLNQYQWCHVDEQNTMCGSMLFAKWCQEHGAYASLPDVAKSNLKCFLRYVDDRDRWQNKHELSTVLADLFFLLGTKLFMDRFLDRFGNIYDDPCVMSAEDAYLLHVDKQRKSDYINALQDKVVVQEREGKHIGFVVCDRYISDAGHSLCDALELDAVVLVSHETVSLRAPSQSSLDMSQIAKVYKGGGHQGAAGFQTSALLGESLLGKVISKFQLP